MHGHIRIIDPEHISIHLSVTMKLFQWEKVREAMNGGSPSLQSNRFCKLIDDLIGMATKNYESEQCFDDND